MALSGSQRWRSWQQGSEKEQDSCMHWSREGPTPNPVTSSPKTDFPRRSQGVAAEGASQAEGHSVLLTGRCCSQATVYPVYRFIVVS